MLLQGEENAAGGQGRCTLTSVVSPGYFRTMGIALLRGRDFTMADNKTTPRVVMVNETAAAAYWPGRDPSGSISALPARGCRWPIGIV